MIAHSCVMAPFELPQPSHTLLQGPDRLPVSHVRDPRCCAGFTPYYRARSFFDLFARHCEQWFRHKGVRAMLDGGDAVVVHYKTVMDREHDADSITREVLIGFGALSVTPFDRGDIKDLITSMDNAIDQMPKTAKTIMLFEQHSFTPIMKEMADVIVTTALLVQEAVPLVLREHAYWSHRQHQRANSQLEGRADELHDGGLASSTGQPGLEFHGVLRRRRNLRSSREGGRPLRRRR